VRQISHKQATNYPHAGDTLQVVAAAAASNKSLFT